MRFTTPPPSAVPHVVHVTTVHPPFDTRIFFKECRSLVEAGCRVSLVAPHERDETAEGVVLYAIPRPRSRRERATRTMRTAWRTARALAADVYHLHDPELLGISLLLRRRGARVLYDVHEDLPRQIQAKEWIPRLLRRPFAWGAELIEPCASALLDGVIAATPVIARRFPAHKTAVVRNFPLLEELENDAATPYAERGAIVVHASANIAAVRGARAMVEAMGALPAGSPVRLSLIGALHEPGLHAELSQLEGWRRVDWKGWLPPPQVPPLLQQARIGLNLLHDLPNYRDALPTKMYEYMAAGLPIVASDFPEWRALYEPLGNTLFVDPCNPQEIAEAISWLVDHPEEADAMGRRGRAAVLREFNWRNEERALLEFYGRFIRLPKTAWLRAA